MGRQNIFWMRLRPRLLMSHGVCLCATCRSIVMPGRHREGADPRRASRTL
ncbi:hypothetical protein [Lysobacter gummosus]